MSDPAEEWVRQRAAVLAHELRTPLAIVRSYCELLRTDPAHPPTEEQDRQLAVIESAALRMQRIIDDQWQAWPLAPGLRMGPVDLPALCAAAVGELTPRARRAGIGLRMADPPPPGAVSRPLLRGDADRLRQVLDNLLGNALKFTPAGGEVVLTAEHEAEAGGPEGGSWTVRVRDTGIGIPRDFLPHVFEPFRRAPNAEGAPGTGLGLPMSRRLVSLHGGTIRVESTAAPGSPTGTTVTLTLPVASPWAGAAPGGGGPGGSGG